MTTILEHELAPVSLGTELLPGYRVRRHLRRGRPYDVYEAFCEHRQSSCVIKTPRPAALDDERVARRLGEEGERLLAFTHPHLVRAYEVIEAPVPAVVMETLGGQTLKHMIHDRGRPIDARGLVHLGVHLSSALGYLHRNRLLHLDLKPSNIVCEGGRAKLIDLSLARPPGPSGRCGTTSYLSPEQALGGEYTAATDVWGLGVVMYESITGQVPFDDSASGDYRQLERRLRLNVEEQARIPATMADVVNACLDPDPARRPFQTDVEATFAALA